MPLLGMGASWEWASTTVSDNSNKAVVEVAETVVSVDVLVRLGKNRRNAFGGQFLAPNDCGGKR